MTYNEVVETGHAHIIPLASKLYGLEGYVFTLIERDYEVQNAVFCCEKEGENAKILRISFLAERSREELLAEAEFIRYLYEHGGSVSNVISSQSGHLLEEITYNNETFFVSLFEKAKGIALYRNGYRYREGVPLTEYFYNCGKALGELHRLSKEYTPIYRRSSFVDIYHDQYINEMIPDTYVLLKTKLHALLKALEGLDRRREAFGLIHADFNDGNYSIDFETGHITVFDFDDSYYSWYMRDLAEVWINGMGWARSEEDPAKRKCYMDDYFKTVLEGYRSETAIADSLLEQLPLFIKIYEMEVIIHIFEGIRNSGEDPESDKELLYLVKCVEGDIPYRGFFHEIYSCKQPFMYEE